MSKIDNDFKFGINLICIISIAAWIGVGIKSMPHLFHKRDFNDNMIEYYKDLSQYNKEDVNCEILKKHIKEMDVPLDSLERFVVDLFYSNNVSDQTISALITEILQPNKVLMEYRFSDLGDAFDLDVATSDDGVIRTYTWPDGTGNYDGYNYLFLIQNGNFISQVDFDYVLYEGEDVDDEYQDFEICNIDVIDKPCYLIQFQHKRPSWSERYATVAIFSIDESGQLVKEKLFNTPNGIVSHIDIRFNVENVITGNSWLSSYEDYKQTIHVPTVSSGEYHYITDIYELYMWDGKYFTCTWMDDCD